MTSYCEFLISCEHDDVGVANVFISHAWRYLFLDVLVALKNHFQNSPDVILWFDLFSNNQHNTTSYDFNWWCSTFKSAIAQFGYTVMVLAPWNNPIPLTRGWCLFEIYCTIETKGRFEIAMSESQQQQFLEDMANDGQNAIDKMLSTIDAENSECYYPQDRDRIFEAVRQSVGFRGINSMILEAMRNWVISTTTISIEQETDYIKLIGLKSTLATLYMGQGKYGAALPLFEECLQAREEVVGDHHPDYLATLHNLASLHHRCGHYQIADPLYMKFLSTMKIKKQDHDPIYLKVLHDVALLYGNRGKFDLAEPLFQECLDAMRATVSDTDPATLTIMNDLAKLYTNQGKYELAEPLFQECLDTRKEVLGLRHPATLVSLSCLAWLYDLQGKPSLAEPLHIMCLETRRELLGDQHPDTLKSLNVLAELYFNMGKYEQAETLQRECLATRKLVLGARHPVTLISISNLAAIYNSLGRYAEAEALLLEYLALYAEMIGSRHPDYLKSAHILALVYTNLGKYELAESLLLDCFTTSEEVLGQAHPITRSIAHDLARLKESGNSPLQVPVISNKKEIVELMQDAEANVALNAKVQQEAPKKVIWGRSRIMIVGEGRAGKTTFYRCMKGESVKDEYTKSTCGLTESNVRFADIEGKKEGISLNLLTDSKDFLDVAASKQIHYDNANYDDSLNSKLTFPLHEINAIPRVDDTEEKENATEATTSNILPITPQVNLPNKIKIVKENFETKELTEKTPEASEKGVPITVLGNISHKDLDISVIDYGGQNIFHCFHHLFLKPYGVYCILFNMGKFLTDEANALYHIRYWYNTIIQHTANQITAEDHDVVPIILVGSHRDKVPSYSDMKIISDKLQFAFNNSPGCASIIRCPYPLSDEISKESKLSKRENEDTQNELIFFPIDNTAENQTDKIFQQLMIKIFKKISESGYVKEKISFDYFRVLAEIERHYGQVNVAEKQKLISFISDFTISIKCFKKPEEILDFFISKGHFLEFNGNIIFHLDKFLVNSITKVIYDPRYHHRGNSFQCPWDIELQILLKRGTASGSFIRKLLREPIEQEKLDTSTKKKVSMVSNHLSSDDNLDNKYDNKIDEVEVDLIVNFMIDNNLIMLIGSNSSDRKDQRYLVPSLLAESKLSHNEVLHPSSFFFFTISKEQNNILNSNNCFMSDNFFYHLVGKLMELSRLTSSATDQDNFVFKDLIMIRLGAHIIILKSFPEASCIQLHALNEAILHNFIIILTFIIETMIPIISHYTVVIDENVLLTSPCVKTMENSRISDQDLLDKYRVAVLCPTANCGSSIFLKVMVFLSNYNISPKVLFYDNNLININLKSFAMVIVVYTKENECNNQFIEYKNALRVDNSFIFLIDEVWDKIKDKLELKISLILGLQKVDYHLRSDSLDSNTNTIKLFKNSHFIGNDVQRFYSTLSCWYYGWGSSSQDDDQISYFKVSVISSETNLFFRSMISLNGSAYVFHQLPEIVSNSSSPAKFLGDIFSHILKSLNPINYSHGNKKNVEYFSVQKSYKILECLVLLSSAVTNSIFRKPLESAELKLKHKIIESIIDRLLKSKSLGDEAKIVSVLLGKNICPLIHNNENNGVLLRKLRGLVFTDSAVMKCISEKDNEKYMYGLAGSWQVSTVIDKTFWSSAKIDCEVCIDQQRSTYVSNCANLSTNPSLLLFLDFLFSLFNLIIVIMLSFWNNVSFIEGLDLLPLLLSSVVLGTILRELGELHCVFSDLLQSQSSLSSIVTAPFRAVGIYFGDFWNFFDVIGLLSLLSWLILQYLCNPPYSPMVEMILSLTLKLSPIPLTIGLLRYFVVLKDIGQFIIIIFSMAYDLWRFGLVYLIFLLGFGISLKAIFYEFEEFNDFPSLFLSMFKMSLNAFSYDTFDYNEYQYVGQAIIVLMVLSVTIVLVNAIIAKFGITFREINENVLGVWAMNKARYITRYLNNSNTALMLPPPMNIAIFIIYLIMRLCAWVCNLVVFFIPDLKIHNQWYAHANLIKDWSIGMCSTISSAVISMMLLPVCAAFEAYVFIENSILKCREYIRGRSHVNQFSIFAGSLSFSKKDHKKFSQFYSLKLLVLSFLWFFYSFFFIIIVGVLLCLTLSIMVLVFPLLVLYFILLLLVDIFTKLIRNVYFLYYEFILSSFFLTKEGRDIWDIQGPKALDALKDPELYNERQFSYISALSRIKWFYDNFLPERSLRLIYEEHESGLGESFLKNMVSQLREGAANISAREGKNIYDTIPPPVSVQSSVEELCLTPKEIKRLFEKDLEADEFYLYQLKHRLDKFKNKMEYNFQSLKDNCEKNRNILQKDLDHKFQKLSEVILSTMKNHNNENTDSLLCNGLVKQSNEPAINLSTDDSVKASLLPVEIPQTMKGKAYMTYFYDVMKTTKIDEGTYVSKFTIGDN